MKTPYLKFCPTPNPPLFVALFLWLDGWSCHIWYFISVILINYIVDLYMLSLGTLVPEGPCSMFYATRPLVYWGLTNDVFFLLLFWFDITQTQTITPSTQRGQWTDIPHVLTTPITGSVLQWMNNSMISKIYSTKFYVKVSYLCFSKIVKLWKSHIYWLNSIRLSSSHEIQRILQRILIDTLRNFENSSPPFIHSNYVWSSLQRF